MGDKFVDYGTSLREDSRQGHVKRGTYNENCGVILFRSKQDKGDAFGFYAMPADDATRKQLATAGFVKDERIGVPHLGDKETWGANAERQTSSFQRWCELCAQSKERRAEEYELSGRQQASPVRQPAGLAVAR